MDKRTQIIESIRSQGLLPLYFHPDPGVSVAVMGALGEAGILAMEYTNRGESALQNFEHLRKVRDLRYPGLLLGAGTIKDAKEARQFIGAGADFLVSPGLSEDVFDASYSEKILWIPGCMSVTEIMRAEQFGLTFVKLFPGSLLGPSFVQAIREIFPSLSFMPTGGVELEESNLKDWFKAGAAAVGMGSKLITTEMLNRKNFGAITSAAASAIEAIAKARKG